MPHIFEKSEYFQLTFPTKFTLTTTRTIRTSPYLNAGCQYALDLDGAVDSQIVLLYFPRG